MKTYVISSNYFLITALLHNLGNAGFAVNASDINDFPTLYSPGINDCIILDTDGYDYYALYTFLKSYHHTNFIILSRNHIPLLLAGHDTKVYIITEKSLASVRRMLTVCQTPASRYVSNRLTLTKRERCVLSLTMSGCSPGQIALVMKVSVKTIYTQRQSLYKKLGIRVHRDLYLYENYCDSE